MPIRNCIFMGACMLAAGTSAQPAPTPPPACTAPEHRQFHFWVGDWDVYPTGKDKLVSHSRIEKLYTGCTIRENWMPLSGNYGGSLNMYDPVDKRWHQLWQDSQNSRVQFDGGLVGKEMVLTGFWASVNGPGQDGVIRMVYTQNADGSVRQHGSISTDQGMTWSDAFDFTYKKRASNPPK